MGAPVTLHVRKTDAARPAVEGNPPGPCHFEVYRADEFRTSSTSLAGGDWRWLLSDAAGVTLVEAGGYRSEDACREAVALLQRHVPLRSFSPMGLSAHDIERGPAMDTDDGFEFAGPGHPAATGERTILALEIAHAIVEAKRARHLEDHR